MTDRRNDSYLDELGSRAAFLIERSTQDRKEAGRLLCEAKEGLPHGAWYPWLDKHGIAPRTASRLMLEYREPEKAERNLVRAEEIGHWADLKPHPINEIVPLDYRTLHLLTLSMRHSGYHKHSPIVIYEGQILDGRLRYLAAIAAGVTPTLKTFEGTFEEAKTFWVAVNMRGRRVMDRDERLALIERFRTYVTEQMEESDRIELLSHFDEHERIERSF